MSGYNVHVIQSKIFVNCQKMSHGSKNWRADYHCFKGSTYAQVVKGRSNVSKNHVLPQTNTTAPVNLTNLIAEARGPSIFSRPNNSGNGHKRIRALSHQVSKTPGEVHTANRFEPLTTLTARDDPVQDTKPHRHRVPGTIPQRVKKSVAPENVSINDTTNSPVREHVKIDSASIDYPGGAVEDKYTFAMAIASKRKCYRPALKECKTLQQWDAQNVKKFGFILMGELTLPVKNSPSQLDTDPLNLHKIIKKSGTHNFLGPQIQIKSQLNPDAWDHLLKDYWDKQLPYLIRYGFPLDFDRSTPLKQEGDNHNSAKQYPQDIQTYLEQEIKFGAILGPFQTPPIQNLHHSPLMTREKPGAPHRQVIVDLSFPKGRAVNTGVTKDIYLGTPFILTLPSIDKITSTVKKWGRGCLIYKLDISRAFRHIKLDPSDYDLLGIRHNGHYIDTCLAFGFGSGSALFQRLSDAIRFILTRRNYDVINYIDDVIGVGLPSVTTKAFTDLQALVRQLGLDISVKKLVAPDTCVNCLGVVLDTKRFTISIPDEKLTDIKNICSLWQGKTSCSRKELQSLLGRLLYISKCVKASRFFLNRMLDVLCNMGEEKFTNLDLNFFQDLNWFSKFLTKFNGVAFFDHRPIKASVELDACLMGMGGCWNSQVYSIPMDRDYKNFTIVHLEMLNLLVAIKIWADPWSSQKVVLFCDNQAVVSVLNNSRTKDRTLAAIARNIQISEWNCFNFYWSIIRPFFRPMIDP